jgi:hypothetical protein
MEYAELKHVIQLGIVVPDAQKAVDNFCKLFNLDEDDTFVVNTADGGISEAKYYGKDVKFSLIIALVDYAGIQFEFIQPVDGDDNPYSDFLKNNGPGIHHTNVMFGDYEKSLKAIEAFGGREMISGKLYGNAFCYWDLMNQMGLTFETAEDMNESLCLSIKQS